MLVELELSDYFLRIRDLQIGCPSPDNAIKAIAANELHISSKMELVDIHTPYSVKMLKPWAIVHSSMELRPFKPSHRFQSLRKHRSWPDDSLVPSCRAVEHHRFLSSARPYDIAGVVVCYDPLAASKCQ